MKYLKIWPVLLLLVTTAAFSQQRRETDPALAALLNQKDSVQLQSSLEALSKSERENDLNLLVTYYNTKQDQNKRDAISRLAIQKFPNGLAAFDKALGEIYDETNAAANEEKYRQLMARFGTNPNLKGHFFFDAARYYVAVSFRDNPAKLMKYLNMIQDTVYKTKAFSYAARETYGRKEYALAESLIKKSIGDETRRSDERSADYYAYAKQYAAVLYANKKYKEGLKYARQVYAQDDKKDGIFNDTYLNLLVANKQFSEAYPLMAQSIKDGRASQEVKAQFKNAYIAVKGSDEGFAGYEQSLYRELKEKISADLAKKMIKEPSFNFSVKDVNGKTVSLSDYRGKTVVLDFWATWCGPCKGSFPHMQAAVNKFKEDTSVVFLFIHTWETDANPVKSAADYLHNNKYTFNLLMDLKDPVTKTNNAAAGYKLKGIPAKFVIDKNGMIRFRSLGGSSAGNDAFVEEMSLMIDLAKHE